MSDINLSGLASRLLPSASREQTEKGFLASFQGFLDFVRSQQKFAVYIDKANGYANVGDSLRRMSFLIQETECKEVALVFDKKDAELCKRIEKRLAFFVNDKPFSLNGCMVTPLDTAEAAKLSSQLIICGGAEQFDPFWATLGEKVRYIMAVQPYLSGDLSFIKIREPMKGEWLTFLTDTVSLNQPFELRPYLLNPDSLKIKTISSAVKAWWEKSYKNISLCEKLISLEKSVRIFPVTGLFAAGTDRGESAALLLALSTLEARKAADPPLFLTFLDFSKADDPHFALVELFADEKKEPSGRLEALKLKYPEASEASLKAGLIDPLMKKCGELSAKLKNIHIISDIPSEPESGGVYLLPLGALPADYRDALFAASSFLFFEEQEYTSVAGNLGIPYLQKSIEAAAFNYPDFEAPAVAAKLNTLCEIFKYDISAYTSGINKGLAAELTSLAEFFKSPFPEYFENLKKISQQRLNDKLAASAGLFMMFKEEVLHNQAELYPKAQLYPTGIKRYSMGIPELYDLLRRSYDTTTNTINLSRALSGMLVSQYLSEINEGRDFVLTLSSIDDIVLDRYEEDDDDDGNGDGDGDGDCDCGCGGGCGCKGRELSPPTGVSINEAAQECRSGSFSIHITDWYGGSCLCSDIHGSFTKPASLFSIPWISFENPHYSLVVPENGYPIKGSVGGTLANTKLILTVDLNPIDGIRHISAEFRTPQTVMDAFYAISGGVDFLNAMPEAIRNIGGFGLLALEFYYDEINGVITSMSFSLATDRPWELWEKDGVPLLTAKPSVVITVNSPASLTKRQVLVNIGAFVGIGDKGSVGTLWLGGGYPPFTAEMRLASEKLSLSELLAMFGITHELNCDITVLRIFADFSDNIYQLAAAVETDWTIIPDMFTITDLGLSVISKGGNISAAFSGAVMLCGKLRLGAMAAYQNGNWQLFAKAAIGAKLNMSDLLKSYSNIQGYQSGELTAASTDDPILASISFSLVKYKAGGCDWQISAYAGNWRISMVDLEVKSAFAAVGYKSNAFYAELYASLELLGADLTIRLNLAKSIKEFSLVWGDFAGFIRSDGNEVTASIMLTDFSIGKLVETFTSWLKGSPYKLDSPWDILNSLKLSTMSLVYSFTKKAFRFTAMLPMEQRPDMGFAAIEGVTVVYDKLAEQKIKVMLIGSFLWQEANTIEWDASQPGTAPSPDGTGNKYFDLRLLVLGQKMHFFEAGTNPSSVFEVIQRLQDGISPENPPAYDKNVGWLVAASFGILKDNSNKYFLDAAFVFYEPSLFAIKITLDGSAAKIFAGLSFELIYAKLSDTLGVYKGTLTLPDKFRRFDIGAYTLTLPDFYAEIYTNGDFKIDLGFPKNGDFSRSFAIEGIIPPGIPIVGFAGIYFGKLSSATAPSSGAHLPLTDAGLFNPAIIYGFGLRMGIGKSIDYGILSGGFSLTLTAIIEGVTAKWCPYKSASLVNNGENEEWYWYLKGTAAVVGQIYGSIDFAIISASVNVSIGISVEFVYETCRAINLTVTAWVRASASLCINLGLFKIKISFSFSLEIRESFKIGENSPAPWDKNRLFASSLSGYQTGLAGGMDFSKLIPLDKPRELHALMALPITAGLGEWEEVGESSDTYILGNVILAVKAGPEHFYALAEKVIFWVVAAGMEKSHTCKELSDIPISDSYLADIEEYLKGSRGRLPLALSDIEQFLTSFFKITVLDNREEADRLLAENKDYNDGVFFPIPPATELCTDDCSYSLAEYNRITGDALQRLRDIFDELAVVASSNKKIRKACNPHGISLCEWVFCDWFLLIARQSIRSMRKVLRDMSKDNVPFGDILFKLSGDGFYADLSGMISRYNFGGLRLPTVDKQGGRLITPLKKGIWVKEQGGTLSLPEEAGLFALCGQEFILPEKYGEGGGEGEGEGERNSFEIQIKSKSAYFELPKDFSLGINLSDGSAKTVEDLSKYLKSGDFTPDFTIIPEAAVFKPTQVSFGKQTSYGDFSLWEIPEALAVYFSSTRDTMPLTPPLFELFVSKPSTDGIEERSFSYQPFALIQCALTKAGENSYIISNPSQKYSALLLSVLNALNSGGTTAGCTAGSIVVSVSILGKKSSKNEPASLCEAENNIIAISQINLSTQTRPPSPRLSRIKQPYAEMLTKLWEALITNNGGYVLTCQGELLGEDAQAEEVTIAIGLEGTAFVNHPEIVNAVVSKTDLEEGEVLTAQAREYECTVSPAGAASLEQLLSDYSCDIRSFAEKNLLLTLNPSIKWSFKNHIYQAKEGQVPGLKLQEIADYFGLQKQDIADANPKTILGEVLPDGFAIKLPLFMRSPKQGDSLASFSARYFIDPVYLLWQNREKSGLLDEKTASVKMTVCAGDRISGGNEGTSSEINEHYTIERTEPPEPDSPSYSAALLESNYTLLRYGVNYSGDFLKSGGSMPTAPEENGQYHIAMPADRYCGGGRAAVGGLLQTRFEWLDYYGNRLVKPFSISRLCGYQDELIGISKWRSVSVEWKVERSAVLVLLSFAGDDYASAEAAGNAHAFYERLISQITDFRLHFKLNCSLFEKPIEIQSKDKIREWLLRILGFLENTTAYPKPPLLTLEFSLASSRLSAARLSPSLLDLKAELVVYRDEFIGSDFVGVRGILQTACAIPLPKDIREFASAFQKQFPSLTVLQGAEALYAFDRSAVKAEILDVPEIFLPRPASNRPLSRNDVSVKPYQSGKGFIAEIRKSYRDVDLNVWLKNALSVIDRILSPVIVSAAQIAGADYNAFLKQKRAIAEKLCDLLCPAFNNMQAHEAEAAKELFLQYLLGSLSSLYEVKAVAALPVEMTAPSFAGKSRFYGNLTLDVKKQKSIPALTLTAPKLSIQSNAKKARQGLTFAVLGNDIVLDSNGAVLPYAALPLTYHVSHIETDILPSYEGFEKSCWLGGITEDVLTVPLNTPEQGGIEIPFPLYTFPEMPAMELQKSILPESPFDWSYSFSYSLSTHYPQAVCHCKVIYNTDSSKIKSSEKDLFSVLALLDHAGEAIFTDLCCLGKRVNSKNPQAEDINDFCTAFNCALELAAELADVEFNAAVCGKRNTSQNEISFTVTEGIFEEELFCMEIGADSLFRIIPELPDYIAEPVPNRQNMWLFKNDEKVYLTASSGQKIRRRTMIMPEFSVLTHQNATAEIYIEQNRELCPKKQMSDCFVFTTGKAAFDTPFFALREYQPDIDLAEYVSMAGEKHSICEYLTEFFNKLFKAAEEIGFSAVVSYANKIHAELPEIITPVMSQTPVILLGDDVKRLLGNGGTWKELLDCLRKNFPDAEWKKTERMLFSITFISTKTNEKLPLLIMKNIFLKGENIE